MPNFTFCRGHEHKTTTFLFFSWTLIQSFRIQLQKKLPTFDELNIRWNKGNKVWGSILSFLSYVFVTAAIVHWCLSYLVIFFQCGGCLLFLSYFFFWVGWGGGLIAGYLCHSNGGTIQSRGWLPKVEEPLDTPGTHLAILQLLTAKFLYIGYWD